MRIFRRKARMAHEEENFSSKNFGGDQVSTVVEGVIVAGRSWSSGSVIKSTEQTTANEELALAA